MSLDGPQIERIQKAILDAYIREELKSLLLFRMSVDLEEFAKPGSYSSEVRELVVWAKRRGLVLELLKCAHEENRTNTGLAELYAEAQTWGAPIPATPVPAPPPMPPGPHQIFLSYSHKDEAIKDRLLADLAAAGLTVWTDDGLEPGTPEWQRAIKEAIRACQCMVVILSPDAEQSEWVNIEIGYAKTLQRRIFPVLARGGQSDAVPIALFNAQYVDLRTDYAGQVQGRLLPALRRHLGAPEAAAPPPPAPDLPSAAPARSSAPTSPARATPSPSLPPHEGSTPAADRGPETGRQPGESATRIGKGQATRPSGETPQAERPARWVAWASGVAAFVIVGALALYAQRDRIWPETSPVAATAQASETWIEPVTGMTFVRVPAGNFTMGSNTGDSDEQPEHRVTLDEYWIGQSEVTNAQFRAFVDGGGYADDSSWTEAGRQWRNGNNISRPQFWDDENRNQPEQPVVGVSWHETVAYANWLSRESGYEIRLPTEAEWEKACRGTDGRTWPWGDQPPDDNRANFNGDVGSTTRVGSYPAGASPYGAMDMAGNVWEWTSSLYKPYPYDAADGREDPEAEGSRTLRGGSFLDFVDLVRCAYRDPSIPDYRLSNVGFRVMSPGF